MTRINLFYINACIMHSLLYHVSRINIKYSLKIPIDNRKIYASYKPNNIICSTFCIFVDI